MQLTLIAVLVMAAGMYLLAFVPEHKQKLVRQSTQGLGGVVFATGLLGFIYELSLQVA